jgi:hypothetical protein
LHNQNGLFYKDLNYQDQKKFNEFKLTITDLGNISKDKILETFIRINEGSIKLNKAELRLAKTTQSNRDLILKLAKTEIKNISNNKKNDKRFKIEELVMRCITILNMPYGKKSVRPQMNSVFIKDLPDIEQIFKSAKRTINCMYHILGDDTIPISSFNTIFETIFCAIYLHVDSCNSFEKHKNNIKSQIVEKITEINKDQMGGGIKFDSMEYISKRIEKISNILKPYYIDTRRLFSSDEKLELWKIKPHVCDICHKEIESINDFEPDHIVAHTLGGRTNLQNARILCRTCNRKEGIKARDNK